MSNITKVPGLRIRALALAIALLAAGNAAAFKPTQEDGHVGITSDAANGITHTTASGEVLKFNYRAIIELRNADAGVDGLVSGEFWDPVAHCDNELLASCSQRLIRLKAEAIAALRAHDPRAARVAVGRALHTLQDFYAHTNWTNTPGPNHMTHNPALGRSVVSSLRGDQQTCIDIEEDDDDQNVLAAHGLTSTTSGYFYLETWLEAPEDKCMHGISGPFGLPDIVKGINKDDRGRDGFWSARRVAVLATTDFLTQVIDAVKDDEEAVRGFLGVRPSIGFVVDTTGSMGRYYGGVKSSVFALGMDAVADPFNAPDRQILQTFNDPAVPAPQIYDNLASLLGGLDALRPSGGGDCPEMAMTGVMSAVGVSRGGSSLFVYTDASAKDSYLGGAVGALAASRKVVLNYIVSGSCSPIDPAYYDTAARTGGALFLAYNTDLATPFVRALASQKTRMVFSASETLADEVRSFPVAVDSGATDLLIAVGTDHVQELQLLDPDGIDVTRDPAIAKTVDFYSGAMLTVAAPKTGVWTFRYRGTGKSFANAYVASPVEVMALDPVELSGRLAHEGPFPVNGSPVLGEAAHIEAILGGASADALDVRRLDGTLVASYDFAPSDIADLGAGVHKYSAPVALDGQPVRFSLRGTDPAGAAFVRAYPTSYVAQPLRVRLDTAAAGFRLAPGTTQTVRFVVDNLGPDADFRFSMLSPEQVIDAAFTAPTLHIASGASATVDVPVTVPADSELEAVTLVASAADVADASRMNSHVVQFMVASRDGDGDGIVDDLDQCPASNLDETVRIDACDSGVANELFEDGCTVADEVAELRASAKNHGAFVSSVSHYARDLVELGRMTNRDHGDLVRCAAQSKQP